MSEIASEKPVNEGIKTQHKLSHSDERTLDKSTKTKYENISQPHGKTEIKIEHLSHLEKKNETKVQNNLSNLNEQQLNKSNCKVIKIQNENISQPNEKTESLVNHLLFHKAMISEENEDRFDKYLNMVEQLKQGTHLAIKDTFDREIAIVFELTVEQEFNPWDIDLIKFSSLYLKKIKKEKEVDLVTSGRIVLMAWTILKLQSDDVLEKAEIKKEEQFDWNDIDFAFTDDADYNYTNTVLNGNIPIEEKVRRKGDRKVSLMELIDAFESAKKDAELRKILEEQRVKESSERKEIAKENVNQKIHKEDLEEDIRIVYSKICEFNGSPIPLTNICGKDICGKDHEEYIRSIISVLYLSKYDKIKVWQRNFPYGEIFIKNLNGGKFDFSIKEEKKEN